MSRAAKAGGDEAAPPPEPDALEGAVPPRANPFFYGHEKAEGVFLRAFAASALHPAWLIGGETGIGKATLAYRLARRVLSEGDEPPDDPSSRVFRQIAALSHPGLFALRRPWQPQTGKFASFIPVDEIRRMKHFFETTAATPWRVVIIDRADDLNVSSANALLKMLEEPPPRSLFLLVSAAPARLFATVRSRCCRMALRPLNAENMHKALAAVPASSLAPEAHAAALWLADGSPRRAMELSTPEAQHILGAITRLLNHLPDIDYERLFALIDKTGAAKADESARALDLLERLLTLLVRNAGGAGAAPPQLDRAQRFVTRSNLALWASLWEEIGEARAEAARLNLDRSALLVTIFSKVQAAARRAMQTRS